MSGSDQAGRRGSEVLIAVDVGTSGARAAAFDLSGRPLGGVRRSYPTVLAAAGWAEQDARQWRSASLAVLGGLVRQLGGRHRILAIGLTGQCPSVVPLDARDEPLRPGIIYRDNRATEQAAAMRARFGDGQLHARTGHVPAAFHVVSKILWIREREPEVFGATRRFLEPSDYVALALTGETVTDWTIATASALFDIHGRRWDAGLLAGLGLDPGLLPAAHPSWAVVGQLRPAVQRRLGLPSAVPVVIGAGDSIACAFGAGVTRPGPVSEMAGSSTCLNSVVAEPLADLDVTHYPSALPGGGFMTEVGINTTGEAVDWVAALAFGGRSGRPRAADFERLDREAATVAPGADGLLFVPVLGDGERDDPDLRGAAVGLSLRHGSAAWARAVLEGVTFGIRSRLDIFARAGAPATELRVSGGGANLAAWNRIKADVLGVPVVRVPGDAAATGVAMLAGLGVGAYADPAAAIAAACHVDAPVDPDAAAHERYTALYERYLGLVGSPVVRFPMEGSPR
jgi:xylulokinase